jgi:hypothetical protein
MGDLRNKQRKDIERAMIRSMQARLDAARLKPVPPRCKCGLTPQQAPTMWVINSDKCWEQADFRCPACLPADLAKVAGAPNGG